MGVLSGYKIVEFAGIGPAPMCAMLLSDMGADVLRIDRTADAGLGIAYRTKYDLLNRGRRSVALDLKKPRGVSKLVLKLVESADALIEGFRPGVMERLGLGPDVCLERNPRLVYGRMTGWGQDGPLAQAAGHDINYIALTGALHSIGRRGEAPVPPLNLVGDFGGGALYLALRRRLRRCSKRRNRARARSSMPRWSTARRSLMTMILRHARARACGTTSAASNILDTGAHYYDTYETKRRQVRRDRLDRAAVLRGAAAADSGSSGEKLPRAERSRALARAEGAGSRRSSRPRRATNGARSWRAATSASRRCCR